MFERVVEKELVAGTDAAPRFDHHLRAAVVADDFVGDAVRRARMVMWRVALPPSLPSMYEPSDSANK